MNIKYFNLFYTVIKNRDENETVVDKYEDNEKGLINFNDNVPNPYIGKKNNIEIFR